MGLTFAFQARCFGSKVQIVPGVIDDSCLTFSNARPAAFR